MASRHDEVLDPAQPALIVTYGNTPRKHRALDRDVVLLGRAHGCDIGLDAIGVLPVHCVIIRREGGFFIRNCAGHGGTRLNGESILEAPLHDADALQIGPFSFQVHLPPGSTAQAGPAASAPVDDQRLRHLLRSRRHLARLALEFRQRVQRPANEPADIAMDQEVVARGAELENREAAVLRQAREQEQRALEMGETQRQLTADREALDQGRAALKLRVQDVEQHLAQRETTVEADLQVRKEEFQRWCQEQELACQERLRQASAAAAPPQAEIERLEIRARELNHFAQHLHRWELRLKQEAEKLPPLQHERQEAQTLQQEAERLQQLVAEKDRKLAEATQQAAAEAQSRQKDLEAVRGQVVSLRGEIQQGKALIQQMQAEVTANPSASAGTVDTERYEAALNESRRQLDAERRSLDEEARQLQERRAELDDAVRETELELSRERAQLARDRVQLERMREEIRLEQERLRDNELRNRLASVQRLREPEHR